MPRAASAPKPAPVSRKAPTREEALRVYDRLRKFHVDAHCELDHKDAFELVCAVVLSAQTTDVAVNKLTPGLFAKYPDAAKLAKASQEDVEELVNRIGMYRQKSKNLIGLAKILVDQHAGKVPDSMEALVALPGVGRKTANVVLGVAFGKPEGVVVDTHVQRITQRLKWVRKSFANDPVKTEQALMKLLPKTEWDRASHVLIFHGRRVCLAQKPNCEGCPVSDACPSAFRAEKVGRKPPAPSRRGR